MVGINMRLKRVPTLTVLSNSPDECFTMRYIYIVGNTVNEALKELIIGAESKALHQRVKL